jgi:peptide methionine sulfoxide reductase MsrB
MVKVVDKVVKADDEWRAQLDDLAYKVTRKHATERAGTHEDFPKGPGIYHCICCGAPLFDQKTKFNSGTGWPSEKTWPRCASQVLQCTSVRRANQVLSSDSPTISPSSGA